MKRLLIYSLLFIVCAGKLFAQVILSDTLTSYQLTSKTGIFEDKTAKLPFEAVQKQSFSAFTKWINTATSVRESTTPLTLNSRPITV